MRSGDSGMRDGSSQRDGRAAFRQKRERKGKQARALPSWLHHSAVATRRAGASVLGLIAAPRSRHCLNLDDYILAGRKYLPRALFAYISGSAGDGNALARNRAAFERWTLVPRMLRGVSERSARTILFDRLYAMPVGVAPLGAAAVIGYDADLAMAGAAKDANVPYMLSANSVTPMEDVIRVNPDAWFAAYLPSDQATIDAMIARIARAGYGTLVITVDVPVAARREAEARARYTMPLRLSLPLVFDLITHPRWLGGSFLKALLTRGVPRIENVLPDGGPSIFAKNIGAIGGADAFAWKHIQAIRAAWSGTLILKGILSPADAVMARDLGCEGIVVSNHGARLFDSVPAPLDMLPEIRAACPELTILLDGGVRRAGDVLKAIALGADGVLIGRPFFMATILGGRKGLLTAIRLVADELARDMGFLGILSPREIREGRLRQ